MARWISFAPGSLHRIRISPHADQFLLKGALFDGEFGGAAIAGLMLAGLGWIWLTRVPLTGWAVSGGGAGMLANAINDWLRAHHERVTVDVAVDR